MSREYYLAAVYGSDQYGDCAYGGTESTSCTTTGAPIGAPGTGQGDASNPAYGGSIWLVAAITCIALALFVVTIAQMIRRRTHKQL